MSTPIQRCTNSLDATRRAIYDQATTQIASSPQLVSEVLTTRTPHETEVVLTQLNIDTDSPVSALVRHYIVDYGDSRAMGSSAPTTSTLDSLPTTYFSPSVRPSHSGLVNDTEAYTAHLRQQEDSSDRNEFWTTDFCCGTTDLIKGVLLLFQVCSVGVRVVDEPSLNRTNRPPACRSHLTRRRSTPPQVLPTFQSG